MASIKRDQIWRKDIIEDKFCEESSLLAFNSKNSNFENDLNELILTIKRLSDKHTWPECNELEELAFKILKSNNVHPTVSRNRFVYGKIFEQLHFFWLRQDETFLAKVYAVLSIQNENSTQHLLDYLSEVRSNSELRKIDHRKIESLVLINPSDIDLSQVTDLRLAGLFVEAKLFLESAKSNSSKTSPQLEFELWMLNFQLHGATLENVRTIECLIDQNFELKSFFKVMMGPFSSSQKNINKKGSQLLFGRQRSLSNAEKLSEILNLIQEFELGKTSSWDLNCALARNYIYIKQSSDQEVELLYLTFWYRQCIRNNNRTLATYILEHYKSLCRIYSDGTSSDLYQWMPDSDSVETNAFLEVSKNLVDSQWSRIRSQTFLSYKIISFLGKNRFQKLLSNKEDAAQLTSKERFELIKMIGQEMRLLKGPIMKLGQTASYWGFDLNHEEQEYLNSLQDRSIPIPYETILKVLATEWQDKLEDDIAYISQTPIGVGSIGQTHLVKTKTGINMAVKIQFPDIKKIISHDFKMLKFFIPILSKFTPLKILKEFLIELKEMMEQECDYDKELLVQKRFMDQYKNRDDIKIAEVYPEYSTSKVLAMEFVEGQSFHEFKATATKDQIDAAGATIAYFVVNSCVHGMFQSDNHPGNFKFLENKICFMDFGSVKIWDQNTTKVWSDVIFAGHTRDFDLFSKAAIGMCVTYGAKHSEILKIYQALVFNSMKLIGEDFRCKFRSDVLHKEFIEFLSPQITNLWNMRPDKEFLFGFRVYFGLIALMSELGAECNWYQIVKEIYAKREMENHKG